jgi:hypothetical protein
LIIEEAIRAGSAGKNRQKSFGRIRDKLAGSEWGVLKKPRKNNGFDTQSPSVYPPGAGFYDGYGMDV